MSILTGVPVLPRRLAHRRRNEPARALALATLLIGCGGGQPKDGVDAPVALRDGGAARDARVAGGGEPASDGRAGGEGGDLRDARANEEEAPDSAPGGKAADKDGATAGGDAPDPSATDATPGPNAAPQDWPKPLRTIEVADAAALGAALGGARPGDEIVVTGAELQWPAAPMTSKGSADAPIVVRAARVGGTTVTAGRPIFSGAEHVTVAGFVFSGPVPEEALGAGVVRVYQSKGIRFTRNVFRFDESALAATPDLKSYWFHFSGLGSAGHRLDRNHFTNKTKPGRLIGLIGYDDVDKDVTIERNRFESMKGPFEIIRVGSRSVGLSRGNVRIVENWFEDVEVGAGSRGELVLVAASETTVRDNVFRSCRGLVSLRYGDDSVVARNLFVEGEATVRVYGDRHLVIGNHFQPAVAVGAPSVTLGMGSVDDSSEALKVDHHDRPQGTLLAFNTFATGGAAIGFGTESPTGTSLPPTATLLTGNLFLSGTTTCGAGVQTSGLATRARNLVALGAGTDSCAGDLGIAQMVATREAAGFTHLDEANGAGGAASEVEDPSGRAGPLLAQDIDGHVRMAPLDVGADQHTTAVPPTRAASAYGVTAP